MARIKKTSSADDMESASGMADDVRKFVIYAADLISEQRNMRQELMATRSDMAAVSKAYERTHRVLTKREAEGITIHIGSSIENACAKIEQALSEPIARAERIARKIRLTAFLSGLLGTLVGVGVTVVLLAS